VIKQIRMMLSDSLIHLGFSVGNKHWSTATLVAFNNFLGCLVRDIKNDTQ